MTRRSIKWRHSREDDPDFKASFEKVIMEISLSSDDNCLGQSRNVEKQYFINHKESVRQNVLMIQKGLRILPKGKESAILDIGTSPMTFVYRKCFPNVRMFTIDLTSLLADRCHKNRIEHCVCDLLKDEIPFSPGQMDMVVFTEVFEHLNTGPGKVFSEIKKILRAGGILVFSLPKYRDAQQTHQSDYGEGGARSGVSSVQRGKVGVFTWGRNLGPRFRSCAGVHDGRDNRYCPSLWI